MEELKESTRASLDGRAFTPKVIPHPYAFNVFSHNTAIDPETGYNDEETKVIKETRKIFEDEKIAIGVTCVRVPVLRAHCEAITFECERPISEDEVRAILSNAPGVKIVDDRAEELFPDADRCVGPGRRSGRPHPQGSQRPHRPFDRDVRLGGSTAEGRGPERHPDRGVAAAARDGVRHGKEIVGGHRRPPLPTRIAENGRESGVRDLAHIRLNFRSRTRTGFDGGFVELTCEPFRFRHYGNGETNVPEIKTVYRGSARRRGDERPGNHQCQRWLDIRTGKREHLL